MTRKRLRSRKPLNGLPSKDPLAYDKAIKRIILIVIALTVIYSENGYTRDKAQPSEWGAREPLIEPNSEMAVALLDGKIYVVGGYPSTRISVDTVQYMIFPPIAEA